MKQPIVLKVYKGDKLEAVRQFEHNQIVIGRNSDVQLELQDEGVALLHAMIEDRGGDYFVSDLGSQNGTFKNGTRLLEDKLASGDELTIGPFRIQFFVGVPKPATPPIGAGHSASTPAPAAVTFSSAVTEMPAPKETAKVEAAAPPASIPSAPEKYATFDRKDEKPADKPVEKKAVTPAGKPSAPPAGIPVGKKVTGGAVVAAAVTSNKGTFAPASPYKD